MARRVPPGLCLYHGYKGAVESHKFPDVDAYIVATRDPCSIAHRFLIANTPADCSSITYPLADARDAG